MSIPSHSLTTLARVKDRLSITSNGGDAVFERLIAAATDLIERECNRRFLSTTYTDELYSLGGYGVDSIVLKQAPVTTLTSVSYRTGLRSNPTWTAYNSDDYELLGDGSSGVVVFYGTPVTGTNNVKATYTAGYLIDFSDPTNTSVHTLPFDITDLCERLVVKLWKRRESEGKTREEYNTGQVEWGQMLDNLDKTILSHYRRVPTFY